MRMQWLPGSLFPPPPREPGDEAISVGPKFFYVIPSFDVLEVDLRVMTVQGFDRAMYLYAMVPLLTECIQQL